VKLKLRPVREGGNDGPNSSTGLFIMTRSELLQELKSSGLWLRLGNKPLWREAFNMYNVEHKTNMDVTCPRCYDKVKKWLEQ